ncbi:MAG TPA: hypothetical protein VMU10_05100 [Desulfomonilia bacterium]|nr:hypothetical protein [Desulfomonilia bacterium]
MSDPDSNQDEIFDKCSQCNGCIRCQEEHCVYNAHGNPEECRMEICTYCERFLQKKRLFLNNVG